MMDTKHYICNYCHEEYIPTRRYAQKFCSASCRSKAHHIKNRPGTVKAIEQTPTKTSTKIDSMSMAGVGNAAVGSLAADALKSMLTEPDNKPATKGDIKALSNRLERYLRVFNLPSKENGAMPYFDTETNMIVYRDNTLGAKMSAKNQW